MDHTYIVAISIALGSLSFLLNAYINKKFHDKIGFIESSIVGLGLGYGAYICIGAFIGVTSM